MIFFWMLLNALQKNVRNIAAVRDVSPKKSWLFMTEKTRILACIAMPLIVNVYEVLCEEMSNLFVIKGFRIACLLLSFVWSSQWTSDVSFPPLASPTHAHEGQRSLLSWVWEKFNRLFWCERDVSLKNIWHQRPLLRWSGISRPVQSAHLLFLIHESRPQCQRVKTIAITICQLQSLIFLGKEEQNCAKIFQTFLTSEIPQITRIFIVAVLLWLFTRSAKDLFTIKRLSFCQQTEHILPMIMERSH